MNTRRLWGHILTTTGGIGMLAGAVDPLEGALVILTGTGLVAFGTVLSGSNGKLVAYWSWIFSFIAVGVGALYFLSAVGGLGGPKGHSTWWGLLILPYPIGWVLGVANLVSRLVQTIRHQHAPG